MKKNLLACIGFILLSGCSENNEPDKIEKKIELSGYMVDVFVGGKSEATVLSPSKDFGLLNMNADIATAWWENDGKTIFIKGVGVGETSVRITNVITKEFVDINVTSHYFSGDFVEVGNKAEIAMMMANQSYHESVHDEIMEIINSRSNTFYSFNKEDNIITIDYSKAGIDKTSLTGTYECDGNELIINHSGITERYAFTPIDFNTVEYVIELGDMLQEMFPEAGVYCASVFIKLSRV